jgi:zinc transport system ATP-binding protein
METSLSSTPPCGHCCTRLEQFSVRRGEQVILEDINLHIHCGEFTAFIGPNGAGKTTLLRSILGEIPHSGSIHFRDYRKLRQNRPIIGYVPQRLDFDTTCPITVLDLFATSVSRRPLWSGYQEHVKQEAAKALTFVEAGHLLQRKIGQLSGGELQRVLLALALCPVPHILMLDEPLSGMDAAGVEIFYHILSELREKYDLAILLVSHSIPEVIQFADRIILLNRIILFDGSPLELRESKELKSVFHLDPKSLPYPDPKESHASDRVCEKEPD